MKLELYLREKSQVYANEAMIILDSYMTANPRTDIRLLLADEKAVDFFRRWSIKRKNYKDMCLNDKRSTLRSRASFRRSFCSLISAHSDEETKETVPTEDKVE